MFNELPFKMPIAMEGDTVMVHNYRKKKKNKATGRMEDANVWQPGIVRNVETRWWKSPNINSGIISFRHSYEVCSENVRLTVGEENIKLIP
jgi:hypothetical protein